MAKGVTERHYNEKLTDNSNLNYCSDCEDCRFWGNDPKNYYRNKWTKVSCDKFPEPGTKPRDVIYNLAYCPEKEPRNG